MTASESALNLIKSHEGLRLDSYRCPAGVLTIGYGHTYGVKAGERITKEQADLLLREDVRLISERLDALNLDLDQNQFDALVSFIFNVGWSGFKESTLLRFIRKNPYGEWYLDANGMRKNTIYEQFQRWIYAKGKPLPGLIKRRKEEASLYLNLKQ